MEILMSNRLIDEVDHPSVSIIEKARDGDEEAFAAIFAQHHLFIYKFIYAMLGDNSLAEELTQETFLGAYRTIGSLRNDSTLRTWLCAIAKNLVFTSFRQNRKEGLQSDEEIDGLHITDKVNPLPDKQVLNKELNKIILSALEKLSEGKRLIFVFREMQDLSYKEISEITGDSISKLKTDLYRAKIEMRSMLRSYMEAKK
ncbi:MAG: RNA polymerase sigma factor [Pyrinomonadaceae bacterium]